MLVRASHSLCKTILTKITETYLETLLEYTDCVDIDALDLVTDRETPF